MAFHLSLGTSVGLPVPGGGYGIGLEQLAAMTMDQDFSALQEYGGRDIASKECIWSKHISSKKRTEFLDFPLGSLARLNTYHLGGSCSSGIKTEGIKEAWYDGGSIALAVIIVIVFTATSDYRQSLQFQNLNEEKRNIRLEVIRGGRRIDISIFDIVVGDVVPLKIGDQVPADGILIAGHSLAIDESSMTGESKIVHKDQKAPFLVSGCKVADGYGTMLVTGVGINTEWGLLMASISEDNGEETPLQLACLGGTRVTQVWITGRQPKMLCVTCEGLQITCSHLGDQITLRRTYFLEKRKVENDGFIHYGGGVYFMFGGFGSRLMVEEFYFRASFD
ncbi:calcium-transporting ATPase 5, plasma membrane-type-like [Tasmannia lanceolata]|uniref:calcium-transporting ATPase 5, plasma membrane-type-like n=1 Tax=Tasmannia lanceolata TaxID=3420 RepID=UPI00406414F1